MIATQACMRAHAERQAEGAHAHRVLVHAGMACITQDTYAVSTQLAGVEYGHIVVCSTVLTFPDAPPPACLTEPSMPFGSADPLPMSFVVLPF